MNRTYFIVPTILMLCFAAYVRWCSKAKPEPTYAGDSPFSWRRPPVLVGPAVRVSTAENYEGRDGAQEARESLRAGKVVLFEFGSVPPWFAERKEIWAREYGVEMRIVVDPIVSDAQVEYFTTFNGVMEAHLVARVGWDAFYRVNREAKTLFDRRHTKKG